MIAADEQIKGILDLIKHKLDVSTYTTARVYYLTTFDLGGYPDYHDILEKLDREYGIMSIARFPDFGGPGFDPAFMEDFQIDQHVKDHLIYSFTITPKFNEFYKQFANDNSAKLISSEDIKMSHEDYNPRTGILSVGNFFKVHIAQQGKKTHTININTEQCDLMKKLFKDEKILRTGFSFNYYFFVKAGVELDSKKVKSVNNIVTEINKKFKEATGLEKLIIIRKGRISISDLYLLKN